MICFADMSFQCLGSWAGDNGETYMSLLDTKLPQLGEDPRPRYRCAVRTSLLSHFFRMQISQGTSPKRCENVHQQQPRKTVYISVPLILPANCVKTENFLRKKSKAKRTCFCDKLMPIPRVLVSSGMRQSNMESLYFVIPL